MAEGYCHLKTCPRKALPTAERFIVSAVIGTVVVAKPIYNALSVSAVGTLANAGLAPWISAGVPILALVGTVYINVKDRSDHYLSLILNSFGLPGTIFGLFLIFSK